MRASKALSLCIGVLAALSLPGCGGGFGPLLQIKVKDVPECTIQIAVNATNAAGKSGNVTFYRNESNNYVTDSTVTPKMMASTNPVTVAIDLPPGTRGALHLKVSATGMANPMMPPEVVSQLEKDVTVEGDELVPVEVTLASLKACSMMMPMMP